MFVENDERKGGRQDTNGLCVVTKTNAWKTVRCECGEKGGLSEHFLVEARLKLFSGWRSAGRMEGVRNVLKVSELNHSVKERAYQESLHEKYEVWRGGEVETVEKEWEKFRDMVMECTNDVCGLRRVGRQRRKGSEWWNEKVGRAVAEKRRAFEEWPQRTDRVAYDRYRAQRVAVKLAVQAAKRMADQRWGRANGE